MGVRFENGVQWYTRGRVEVVFPQNCTCCRYCIMMRSDAGNTRHVCISTGRILADIDWMPVDCPIEELKEDNHE